MPGYKLTVTNSPVHCGGKKLVVTRPKARPTTDTEIIAVFELEFPTGLSFDPAPEKKALKEKSLKRFNDFVGQLTKSGAAATDHYSAQLAATKDPEASYAAAARLLQMGVHTARLLAYAEIPKDVRTGELKDEKIEAFCDQMSAVAEPLDARAREALTRCQAGATQFASTWWAPLCTLR